MNNDMLPVGTTLHINPEDVKCACTGGDLISRDDLINAKPEFLNETVVHDTKYQTAKARIYAKAWNACISYWLDIIKNALTVDERLLGTTSQNLNKIIVDAYQKGLNTRPQGKWIIVDDCEQFIAKCSICGRIEDSRMVKDYPFCHCGAAMRGSIED